MITLSISFVLLSVLDLLLTVMGLSAGLMEANPLLQLLGWNAMIGLKAGGALGLPLGAVWINRRSEKRPIGTYLMNTVVILMIVVCIWNTAMIGFGGS